MPVFSRLKSIESITENETPGAAQTPGDTPDETPDLDCELLENRPSIDVESNLNVPDNSVKEIFLPEPSLKESKDPSIAPSFSDRDMFLSDFKPDTFKQVGIESSRDGG